MPPKKDTANGDAARLLTGFEDKETKLLAAAFVSCIGPDKYDYDLMSTLTGNTNGSLKKMWPPVKKKAIDAHASFATFLGSTGASITTASGDAKPAPAPKAKATGGRKRKAAADTDIEDEIDTKDAEPTKSNKSDGKKSDSKPEVKTKAPAAKSKGRPKKAKKEELSDEKVKSEEDSADGGDGLETLKEVEEEEV